MRFRIHVSGSVLARNAANGRNDPAIIVATKNEHAIVSYYMANDVTLRGRMQLIQRDGRVWLEGDTLHGAEAVVQEGRIGLDPDQPTPPEDW